MLLILDQVALTVNTANFQGQGDDGRILKDFLRTHCVNKSLKDFDLVVFTPSHISTDSPFIDLVTFDLSRRLATRARSLKRFSDLVGVQE